MMSRTRSRASKRSSLPSQYEQPANPRATAQTATRSAFIAVIVFVFLWTCFLAFAHYSVGSVLQEQQQQQQNQDQHQKQDHQDLLRKRPLSMAKQQQQQHNEVSKSTQLKQPFHTHEDDITKSLYYGWQPRIAAEMTCPWRKCFAKDTGAVCGTSCRDDIESFGVAPPVPSSPSATWIPDVTMLHRMHLEGRDANGNPWPPPLSRELCDDIGIFGGFVDDNKKLLEGIVIQDASPSAASESLPTVFCGVYTMKESHHTTIRAIRETWAGLCDGFLAFSTESDPRIPAVSLEHDGPEEYNNMWQKVRSIWRFIGEHYRNDFDYFMLGGEDMFVIPQNLKVYLSTLDKSSNIFAGRRFKGHGDNNYFNSGGAGYVLSRGTLGLFHETGLDDPQKCHAYTHTAMEDVMIAECLRKSFHIGLTDTRDAEGRERFHPFSPGSHLTWKPPGPFQAKDWYEEYNKEWGLKLGKECCAPDSVSFHYIKKPPMVRHLYALLNDCRR